jgi:hypothetical protein
MLLLPAQATHATTITVMNWDGAGEGFNDPTPRGPEGGNPGVMLGQLRHNALQEAADRWAAFLSSSVEILIQGKFDPLYCDPFSALLGYAGPNALLANWDGAPLRNTWYVQAIANSIAGTNLSPRTYDIGATLNSNIDNGCLLTVSSWYYGFDGNPPAGQIDLIPTVLHELAHGLGFITTVDLDTGARFLGWNDTFMLNLEDHSTGALYPDMTDAQRVAASINTGNLHWVGANVRAVSSLLSAGKTGDHVHMYAPNPKEPGSSVSHFDTSLTPDELMEPRHTPTFIQGLTEALFKDIGWNRPTPTPNKCLAGKIKCANKKMAGLLKCHNAAEKSGLPVDAGCLSKTIARFDGGTKGAAGSCFGKLEVKNEGPCRRFDDLAAIEAKVDAFVLDVVQELDPSYPAPILNACSAGKKKCVLKKTAGKLTCWEKCQKDLAKCEGMLTDCLDKAEGKYDGGAAPEKGCFAKLEAAGDSCITTGDSDALEAKVDAFVGDVLQELENAPTPTVTPTPDGP